MISWQESESTIHKILRYFSPALVTTQSCVVAMFWGLLYGPLIRKVNPNGWDLFYGISSHSVPWLLIISDYMMNNVHHPRGSYWLSVAISLSYIIFWITYQCVSGDVIYDTPMMD